MTARVESQAGGADGAAPSIPSAFENDHMLGATEAVMWIACRRRFSHETIREHLKRRALNLQRLTRSPQDSSQDRPQVSPVLQSRVDKAEFQLFRLITDGVPAIGTLDDEGHPDHEKRVPVPVEFLKDGAYIELQSGHIRADSPLEKHYGYQRPTYRDVSIDRDAFFKALAAADPKERRDTLAAAEVFDATLPKPRQQRSRGRRARGQDAARAAAAVLYPDGMPDDPWKTITADVNKWLVENKKKPVSEDTVYRALRSN